MKNGNIYKKIQEVKQCWSKTRRWINHNIVWNIWSSGNRGSNQGYIRRQRACILAPTSKKGGRLIAHSVNQESNKDYQSNQSQKTHRIRRSETISQTISPKVMMLSWFFWQVLGLENTSDWKESSHRLKGSWQWRSKSYSGESKIMKAEQVKRLTG